RPRPGPEDRPYLESGPQRLRAVDRRLRCDRIRLEGRTLRRRTGPLARMIGSSALRRHGVYSRARDGPERASHAPLAIAIAAAALAGLAGVVYLAAVSRHAPAAAGHAALIAVLCVSYVTAGVVALLRPPSGRFGLLLAAVGFASLPGGLRGPNRALLL